MMMGEEKKIEMEEVDGVATPPRARVTPETPVETFERKRDYLAGFLTETKPAPEKGGPGGELQEAVIEALKSIYDPEIPVDIYELGLIYDILVDAASTVGIRMTLTAPACPAAQFLPEQVRTSVAAVPGVSAVKVDVVWEPPWDRDRMSEAAKLQLGLW